MRKGVQLYTFNAEIAIRGYPACMENMPLLNDAFAAALRTRRESAGLTQKVLAERIGASLSAIKKLEHGDRIPSLKTLLVLSQGLEVDPRDFVADIVRMLAFLEDRMERDEQMPIPKPF